MTIDPSRLFSDKTAMGATATQERRNEVTGKPAQAEKVEAAAAGKSASIATYPFNNVANTAAPQDVYQPPPPSSVNRVRSPEEIAAKVDQYLKVMNLEEKIGQMVQFGSWGGRDSEDKDGIVRAGKVGSLINVTGANEVNRYQRMAMEETRLGKMGMGIPILFGLDVYDRGYRTIGPNSLGFASSFDPELVRKQSRLAGYEARSAGVLFTCGPNADVTREPRWGRVMETYGESSKLAAEMVRAGVNGFHDAGVGVTLKHFVGYGGLQAGREYQASFASPQQKLDYYLPSFRAGIEAGAEMVMPALSSLNGKPPTADYELLHEVLEKGLGFKGVVLSDYLAPHQLVNFGVVKGNTPDEKYRDAAVQSANAGIHIEMEGGPMYHKLAEGVRRGEVPMETIDEAVRRVLTMKFKLGLFDNPYTQPGVEEKVVFSQESRDAARAAAARSMVLLKNEGNILPLAATAKKIAVVGPLADNQYDTLGSWHARGRADEVTTVLKGIKAAAAPDAEVTYSYGVDIDSDKTDGIAAAVEAAKNSEVIVAVVGEGEGMSGEAASRANIKLPGKQEELLKALAATGKPVVAVLINGRPLEIPWLANNVGAIVEAWQPGTEGGHAVADVLFGKVNPGGKLPMTFPRSVGQLPIHHDAQAIGRPKDAPDAEPKYHSTYLDMDVDPQYAFGHGLSYTTFNLEGMELSSKELTPDGKLKVRVTVKNTGDKQGDEVVQLYARDEAATLARPVKELKGFQRVTLEPGETKTVELELKAEDFVFTNERGQQILEPGTIKLMAGTSSDKLSLKTEFELKSRNGRKEYVHQIGGAPGVPEAQAFEEVEAKLAEAREAMARAESQSPTEELLAQARKELDEKLAALRQLRADVTAAEADLQGFSFRGYGKPANANGVPAEALEAAKKLREARERAGMNGVIPMASPAEMAVRIARRKLNELQGLRDQLVQAQESVKTLQREWLKAREKAAEAN